MNYLLSNNELGVWPEMPNELYVIGDIHGDFFALKQSLELTGCISFDPYNDKFKINNDGQYYYLDDGCEYYKVENNNVKWKSEKKNCFIVFSGDLTDRCRPNIIANNDCKNTVSDENCDYLLIKLLYELDKQARQYNSRVIVLLGNHEILNLQDDSNKYVSLKGRKDISRKMNIKKYLQLNSNNVYGIVRINKYIIVHGGINNIFFYEFNKNKNIEKFESIELFNQELRNFLIHNQIDFLIKSYESPFWDRTLGGRDELNVNQCKDIFDNNILKIKNFDTIKSQLKVIVAHCPQFTVDQTINLVNCQEYENKIFRIDVGMSRAFDLYNLDKIKQILNNNYKELLNMNYNDFFMVNNLTKNRAVSCLKLTNNSEEIIKGKLTIDYFYGLELFNNNKNKQLIHLLSDIKKIYISHFNLKYIPTEQNIEIINIKKISELLDILSKQ